ncbi:hypothetical protein [Alkalicoccobacillus gibsonii]|uniref:hypothetical protein n=1 Tax=Alkalicoccobacillus gibsonii TaxID=79881 RepID=UPI0019348A51|nr:hypothetical protein [Alkalicoccobacillus gibsonii]MBM0067585.1 hypothetical protein [Alkalicoccobacillus gibsonii]
MANPFQFSKRIGFSYIAVAIAAFLFFHFFIEANILLTLLLTVPCGLIGILTLANHTNHRESS